ncbi:transporter substrate-binding domain-containing protein [Nodosilinea sp. LEGE 07298]|uniref:transporter substrate-binding domain-containing protein n=1 Tax=Nodosilinea sp. LEGE 07298 TaxID=2777970 RepID=UPI001D13C2A2|nr:transporter substrate-binding domain-containing protein [Nodosilinea sp. LEGE 07298]
MTVQRNSSKSTSPRRFLVAWRRPWAAIAIALVMVVGIVACGGGGSITDQSVAGDATATAPAEGGAPATAGSTLDAILSRGTVRVAVPQDSSPFGFVGTDMQPQGYDVDVAGLLAEALEVDLELVPVTSTNRIPYLQTDRVDVVISSLGATPERAKSIYFSRPYAPFFSGIYGAAGVAVSAYDDLSGYRVGVTQGAIEDLDLSSRGPEDMTIQRYDDNSTTVSALLAGQVDLIAVGNTIAAQVIQENPGRNLENKFVIRNSPCYIGVRRGDLDMLQWLNVFVTNHRLDGSLDELSEKWFGEPLELPNV